MIAATTSTNGRSARCHTKSGKASSTQTMNRVHRSMRNGCPASQVMFTSGISGRILLTSCTDQPVIENTTIACARTSRATCTADWATTRLTDSSECGGGAGWMRCGERSATSTIRAMVRTASTGYRPAAVSPDSITASVPSKTALATSLASARVGRGEEIMLSSISVAVMTGVVDGLEPRVDNMRAAITDDMMAAGLAVALARDGLPFRKAHALVGALVAKAQDEGTTLADMAARSLAESAPTVAAVFDPDHAVAARAARGGTSPEAVRESLAEARKRLGSS